MAVSNENRRILGQYAKKVAEDAAREVAREVVEASIKSALFDAGIDVSSPSALLEHHADMVFVRMMRTTVQKRAIWFVTSALFGSVFVGIISLVLGFSKYVIGN